MPIIEQPNSHDDLSQGDILEGVNLFESIVDSAGKTKQNELRSQYCLVLSRDCVCAHKDRIVVSEIAKLQANVGKEVQSFQDALDFLNDLRSNDGAPDCFYLGNLPNLPDRYVARLDSVHTVNLKRTRQIVQGKRIARLTQEFIKDLQLRFFRSFASFGFDDHSWFTTEDLEFLVSFISADKAKFDVELTKGSFNNPDKAQKIQSSLAQYEIEVRPFREELERRKSKQIASTSPLLTTTEMP